ncbi:MAG: hypothetical protein U0003_04645 [Vampirovibrionales bacterium]
MRPHFSAAYYVHGSFDSVQRWFQEQQWEDNGWFYATGNCNNNNQGDLYYLNDTTYQTLCTEAGLSTPYQRALMPWSIIWNYFKERRIDRQLENFLSPHPERLEKRLRNWLEDHLIPLQAVRVD